MDKEKQQFLLPENYSDTTGNITNICNRLKLITSPNSVWQLDTRKLTYSVKKQSYIPNPNPNPNHNPIYLYIYIYMWVNISIYMYTYI